MQNFFWEAQKRRGRTLYDAEKIMRERNYFGAMMVVNGDADAMISGYSRNYPQVVRPILEITAKKGQTPCGGNQPNANGLRTNFSFGHNHKR